MAEMISYVDPKILKAHPRNAEFFDDVDGTEFDRLVESVKDHGVLTPLRVTKGMTIISGHQRVRAAIEAGATEVPVIIDGSENGDDVLMKLIETNFGRIKNDPIKQAKWIEEYKALKGIRRGKKEKGNNFTLQDIADKLGVDVRTVKNISSLTKLDPALQALISDGKINATTGFKILAKLSPEEQIKLLDKLPNDVKLSSESVKEYIDQMRDELAGNVSKAMQERDKLVGEKERLIRENNELRAGALPRSSVDQEKIDKLETERRSYYEKSQRLTKETERLRGEIDKALKAKAIAEAKAKGGDEASIELENQIQELLQQLEASNRKANDLEFQLETKEDEIKELQREKKEGFERKALRLNETPEELVRRERDALQSDTQLVIGEFITKVGGLLIQADDFGKLDREVLRVLVETCSEAVNIGNRLKTTLLAAGEPNKIGNGNDNYSGNGDDLDDDESYLDNVDLDCNKIGA